MKNILIYFLIISNPIIAQKELNFRNQGEVENHQSIKFFDSAYVKNTIPRYKNSIEVLNNNNFKFNDKVLTIWNTNLNLYGIFSEGILYPQLFVGTEKTIPKKTKEEILSMSDIERINYRMNQNDSVKISDLEELKFLSKSHKIKRFRFWYYVPGFNNPQVYFIELINKKATRKMKIDDFIKGSELTFIKGAWLII
jgi:hypothetical protein